MRPKGLLAFFASRRRTLVVSQFQRRFIATQILWLVVTSVALLAVVFVPTGLGLYGEDPVARQAAADQFLALHGLVWPLVPVVFLLAGGAMVIITHRLAGPLYRFRRVFEAVDRGQLTQRVRLRKGDHLTVEAAVLDRMVGSLRDRIGSAQGELAELQARLHEATNGGAPVTRDDLVAIADGVGRAGDCLRHYDTGGETPERGFTLIELLVAVAIIGVVAAIGLPLYSHALDTARIARASGDINGISKAAQSHHALTGCYPSSLVDMGTDHLRDPWNQPYRYAVLEGPAASCPACNGGCIGQGAARTGSGSAPLNTDFDVFSTGPDLLTAGPLSAAESQDDVVRADGGGFVGLAANH